MSDQPARGIGLSKVSQLGQRKRIRRFRIKAAASGKFDDVNDPLLNMVLTDVYWDVDVRCWLQQTWALTRTVAHRSAFRNIYCANIVADSNAAPLRLRWDRWRSPRSSRRDLTLSVGR